MQPYRTRLVPKLMHRLVREHEVEPAADAIGSEEKMKAAMAAMAASAPAAEVEDDGEE